MESSISAPAVASALTSDLFAKIRQVTRSLPEAHLLTPAAGELFKSREAVLLRLQNWALPRVSQSSRKADERIGLFSNAFIMERRRRMGLSMRQGRRSRRRRGVSQGRKLYRRRGRCRSCWMRMLHRLAIL
jgi:hypothetical protein